jgi:uncharacterized protein YbjT (DUF2867 family)
MILIIGASGSLGSRIATRLLEKGEPVRLVTRNPAKLDSFRVQGADIVHGDLRDPSWMPSALAGTEKIVLAAHGLVPPTRSNTPAMVDGEGNRRIIDAAKQAGVKHIIFISVQFASADTPVEFGRIKYMTELYLQNSGIAYTIIRPAAFIETHALMRLGEPLRSTGKVKLFGSGQTPIDWISVDDVAEFAVRCTGEDQKMNTVHTISGADTFTTLQVIGIIEKSLGIKAKMQRIPIGLVKILRITLSPFNPGLKYIFDVVIAEDEAGSRMEKSLGQPDWRAPTTVEQVIKYWKNGK